MNRQLNESLDRLVGLFASAHEHERSEEPLRRWKDACRQIEAVRASKGMAPGLDRMGACLASMEGVVRCWAEYGFECSFRLAGNLVETIRLVDLLDWNRAFRQFETKPGLRPFHGRTDRR